MVLACRDCTAGLELDRMNGANARERYSEGSSSENATKTIRNVPVVNR